MTETARLGALMIVHAEDADAIEPCAHGPSYAGFLESRPDAAEERAIGLVQMCNESIGPALPTDANATTAVISVSIEG